MALSCVLRMWLNAQQIMQWQWAYDARQISKQSTIQIAHFPFPFFQRFATSSSRQCPRPETYAMSCHSNNEATGASGMPKFTASPFQRCDCPRKDFDASWIRFRAFVGAYALARPSVPLVWSFFIPTGHWACPCAMFLQYREAHYPFRFSSDGELTT